jgi:hypothetical protein
VDDDVAAVNAAYGPVTPSRRPEDWRRIRAAVEKAVADEIAGADYR